MAKSHAVQILFIVAIIFSSACSVLNKDGLEDQSEIDSDLQLTEDASLVNENDYKTRAVLVENNIVYVGVGNSVSILKFANPTYYDVIGMIGNFTGTVNDIESSGDILFIAEEEYVHIIDVTDPAFTQEVGTYHTVGKINDILILENTLYIAGGELGIQNVDISNLTEPEKVGEYDTPGNANGIAIEGKYAYVADGATGIRVLDISDLSMPKEVSNFDTPGISNGIYIDEHKLYIADGEAGLMILDISNPTSMDEIGIYDTMGNTQNVTINGNYAFLADGENGMSVLDVSNPATPKLEGIFNAAGEIVDIEVSRGVAYAAAGENGLRVVDLIEQTIPYRRDLPSFRCLINKLTYIGTIKDQRVMDISGNYAYIIGPMVEGLAPGSNFNGLFIVDISNYEDIKIIGTFESNEFQKVVDIFATPKNLYILDSMSGLHIVDVSDPTSPIEISLIENIPSAESIFVKDGYVYIVGYALGLRVYDVSNPLAVSKVNSNELDFSGRSIKIKDNFAYIAAGEDGLIIIDISNPKLPKEVTQFATPGIAKGLCLLDELVFIADGEKGLQIIDISDVTDPKRIGFYENLQDSHDVSVADNLAYIANGESGLSVIDISVPEMLIEVNSLYDPNFTIDKVNLGNGHLFYFAGINNVYIYDISNPQKASDLGFFISKSYLHLIDQEKIDSYSDSDSISEISIGADYAYLSSRNSGITKILNISNPKNIFEEGYFEYFGNVNVVGNYAYVAARKEGLIIFDISDIKNPVEIGSFDTPGDAVDVDINGNYAYVCDYEWGMHILDISDPNNPFEVGSYDDSGQAREVVVVDGIAYIANGVRKFTVVDVSNPANPTRIKNFSLEGQAYGITVVNNLAYVAWNVGLQIIDISNPFEPTQIYLSDGFNFQDIAITDNLAVLTRRMSYLINSQSSLSIYDISNPYDPKLVSSDIIFDVSYIGSLEILADYVYVPVNGVLRIIKLNNPISTPEVLHEFSSFENIRNSDGF